MRDPSPYRVCFVCTGNICRSPMAESVFRAHAAEVGLDGRVEVDSAGTGPWHEGDGADRRAIDVLTAHGYEQDHIARHFQADWFDHLDLVIALDSGHLHELRALAPTPQDAAKVRLLRSYDPDADQNALGGLDVPDPYFGGTDDFEECLDMIEAASGGLLDAVTEAIDATESAVEGTPGSAAEETAEGTPEQAAQSAENRKSASAADDPDAGKEPA
ncbi:protein tyrosine phosphatase [Streptomyces violaceusniger]|uniref:protein-tyrosine-phosphatase n=3 Tax=Streptomyces TaxID=1883 RepID=A0ABD5J8W6_9ACTN|nr:MULTISPECIES: low molecular weight protein-tyrosine-phosphatase [Streptomyces]KUL62968.1 protein tyrosine phosphatase [Streptomyces violaceusniger]MEE4584813.1 low molecular weight protein-tyrosine-phosphatase [Streptomyces sp. DSM 41602]RSS34840.1 low molecular weight phosphotyrosine protein phosphatase [Streptomyces sp. WAC05858]